jgi:two-component system, chemotaxis family, chemotaxis protein CheY
MVNSNLLAREAKGPPMMNMQESKGRILFVNDDPDTYELVTLVMKEIGYETVIAMNINEGLNKVKAQEFDFILIDWFFEDGMGIDLCRNIRGFDGQTPIFFYTGECRQIEINKALAAGAQGCFLKPVEISYLMKTLTRQNTDKRIKTDEEQGGHQAEN